jgi:hypothetical protein
VVEHTEIKVQETREDPVEEDLEDLQHLADPEILLQHHHHREIMVVGIPLEAPHILVAAEVDLALQVNRVSQHHLVQVEVEQYQPFPEHQ